MSRKRTADTDIGPDDNSSDEQDQDSTWQEVDQEEMSRRKIVKASRGRRVAEPKPQAAAAFPVFNLTGASSPKKTVSIKPSSPAPGSPTPPNPLAKLASAPGTWQCACCLLANKAADSKCVACETAKPSGSPKPKSPVVVTSPKGAPATPATNLFAKFAPAAGSWQCSCCLVANKPDAAKCAACETPNANAPKTDAAAPSKSPTLTASAAVGGGFTFGAPASGGGFQYNFGGDKTAAFGTGAGFKFGASTEGSQSFSSLSSATTPLTTTATPTSTFSFLSNGANASAAAAADSGFKFNSSESTFGSETAVQPALPTEKIASGEEDEQVVLRVVVLAYQLKEVEKEVDGKVEAKASWAECGSGDLHVNTYDDAQGSTASRLVLRMAKTHRLTLNVPLFREMSFERVNEKMIRLASVIDGKIETYLLKTKLKSDADSLADTIQKLIAA